MTSHAETSIPNTSALSVSISADETAFTDGLSITFSLTNNSSQAVHVLKWDTPLENAFNSDMFEVWQSDTRMSYTGKLVKRGQPKAQDFISLEPGETVSQGLDVADGYGVYDAGDYTIMFNSSLTIIKTDNLPLDNALAVSSDRTDRVTLKSVAITSHLLVDRFKAFAKIAPEFSSCSDTQRNTLDEALSHAETMAEESANALASTSEQQRSNADRYGHWFGVYDATRYNTVSDHFNKIHDALANRQITFDCACDDKEPNVVAFIRRIEPYRIHLCDIFWMLNMTDNESMAGSIIHETSHFNETASTDDHAYGRSDVQNLAQRSPSQAIDNADSYQYFAENASPIRSMDNTQPPPDNTQPPAGNNNTAQLTLNQPVTAQIGADEMVYYKVTGASKIVLSEMTSDFDLIVKADALPSFFDNDCMPLLLGTAVETCEVSNTGTYFVAIISYPAGVTTPSLGSGTFTLVAEGVSTTTPVTESAPKKGLWWSPQSADNSGFDIQISGNQLTVVWYTYDEIGLPIWYLADGTYSNNQGNAILRKYHQVTPGSLPTSQEIGNIQLDFSDLTHATMSWSINEKSGNQAVEYFIVSDQATLTDHTGLWYEPVDPGYGITVHEQGSSIVTVIYYYDTLGIPAWALGDSSDDYQLNSYQGSCPYCPPRLFPSSSKLGDIDINFSSHLLGTLSVSFDAHDGVKWKDNASIINLTP